MRVTSVSVSLCVGGRFGFLLCISTSKCGAFSSVLRISASMRNAYMWLVVIGDLMAPPMYGLHVLCVVYCLGGCTGGTGTWGGAGPAAGVSASCCCVGGSVSTVRCLLVAILCPGSLPIRV